MESDARGKIPQKSESYAAEKCNTIRTQASSLHGVLLKAIQNVSCHSQLFASLLLENHYVEKRADLKFGILFAHDSSRFRWNALEVQPLLSQEVESPLCPEISYLVETSEEPNDGSVAIDQSESKVGRMSCKMKKPRVQ